MTLLEIVLRPWKAQYFIRRLEAAQRESEAYRENFQRLSATVIEFENELNWLAEGPGVKRVKGGFICRHYPLNVQPVWKTLREAVRYGMEAK